MRKGFLWLWRDLAATKRGKSVQCEYNRLSVEEDSLFTLRCQKEKAVKEAKYQI